MPEARPRPRSEPRPTRFVDQMVAGAFSSLRHIHDFRPDGTVVVMRNTLTWQSPLGPLGVLADRLFLVRYLRSFMIRKQSLLKAEAEQVTSGDDGALAR